MELVTSCIARDIVFPNHMRALRKRKRFATLGNLHELLPQITYTRLAKIERGQIIPTLDEIDQISKALGVYPMDLFMDPDLSPEQRETWAQKNIDCSLKAHDAGLPEMILGAALRICRLDMNRSTTAMKEFGLPAATVSRIENGERPLERFTDAEREYAIKLLRTNSWDQALKISRNMHIRGRLNKVLEECFSWQSYMRRITRGITPVLIHLAGPRAKAMRERLEQYQAAA